MHSNLCVPAVPRWIRPAMYVSLVAAAAAVATQVMRGPRLPFTQPTLPRYAGLPVPPQPDGESDEEKARKAFTERFAAAEDVVKHSDEKTCVDLRNARDILNDLELTDTTRFGADYPDRIKDLKAKAHDALVRKLPAEAKQHAAAAGTTPRDGIARYAEAEDFVRKALVDAKQTRSATVETYTEIYKALLQDSDAYSKRVITKEFMESVPWKDLLDADTAQKWSKTTTVPGFACRIENGVLTVSPPDTGCKMQGVCGVLDQKNENLRHFMLDMEFSVDGVATMFFHVSPPPQNPDNRQSETYDLSSKDGGREPNERCSLVATYIGSDLTVWFPQTDIPRYENTPNWVKLRRGGIAFLIPEGTKLRITRMRIRDIR